MNQQNAPEVPVLSDEVREMIETVSESLSVVRPSTRALGTKLFYEAVVEGTAYKYYSAHLEYDHVGTISDIREWLDKIEQVSEVVGIEPTISGNYDGFVEAYFSRKEPYEPEEVELAKHRLEIGDYTEAPDVIRWRKPIPFEPDLGAIVRGEEPAPRIVRFEDTAAPDLDKDE